MLKDAILHKCWIYWIENSSSFFLGRTLHFLFHLYIFHNLLLLHLIEHVSLGFNIYHQDF